MNQIKLIVLQSYLYNIFVILNNLNTTKLPLLSYSLFDLIKYICILDWISGRTILWVKWYWNTIMEIYGMHNEHNESKL